MTFLIGLLGFVGIFPVGIGILGFVGLFDSKGLKECDVSKLYLFLCSCLFLFTGVFMLTLSSFLRIQMSPSVNVTKDFNIVWSGKKHCLDVINNLGDTHIKTYKGFLCLTPDKYFYGKDIEVNSVSE